MSVWYGGACTRRRLRRQRIALAASLSVALDAEEYAPCADIEGTATVAAGVLWQQVRGLTAAVVCGQERAHDSSASVLKERLWIGPQDRRTFRFALRVPDSAEACDADGTTRVCVTVGLLGWPRRLAASVPIRVPLHRELLAVQRAVESVGFARLRTDAGQTPDEDGATSVDYAAPPRLSAVLDSISLQLRVRGRWVNGDMLLRRRHGAAPNGLDRWWPSVDVLPLRFARSELLAPDGAPCPAAAVPAIERLLEPLCAELEPCHTPLPAYSPCQAARPDARPRERTRVLAR